MADSRNADHPRAPCGFPDPPSGEASGEFMHERKKLTPVTRLPLLRKILAKELKPIWPLFGVVASGFFLAGWIVGRNLGKNPEIRPRLNKERRAHEVPEIDEPELVASLGQEFLERDLLRDVVKMRSSTIFSEQSNWFNFVLLFFVTLYGRATFSTPIHTLLTDG
ncbi:hypothetical protein KFL_000330100 [Klebsormidium nitens]|uniref:Uncharacterized protein n=1 Tax=Klebsormidium nitens TaxID=105231 RepID=A0A1Y1HLT2_KLENI|nr:hypothetical protein KFL_000330100 [Klebsormidium nitens]|eukprot:GAQ79564.1 hypothetical protein KFL_000330100 [Klebsormidium nitens]